MREILKKMGIVIPEQVEVNYLNALTHGYMSTEKDFNNLKNVQLKVEKPKQTRKKSKK